MLFDPVTVAASRYLSPTEWGTAQDLTLGIFMGVTIAVAILSLFFLRSGHERAHRSHVLRGSHAEQIREWRRSEELERLEPPPRHGEATPR